MEKVSKDFFSHLRNAIFGLHKRLDDVERIKKRGPSHTQRVKFVFLSHFKLKKLEKCTKIGKLKVCRKLKK